MHGFQTLPQAAHAPFRDVGEWQTGARKVKRNKLLEGAVKADRRCGTIAKCGASKL
jgi:hypothetical protein